MSNDYFDHGLNTAPEHGHRDFGQVGDGGPIPATVAGTRPPVPHDPLGTVSPAGPTSEQTYTPPPVDPYANGAADC